MPRGAITLRPTPRDRARLESLTRRLDTSQTEVMRQALIHMLATIERGEAIHRYVPSEQAEPKEPPAGQT